MRFALLGPIEVAGPDGVNVPLGKRKDRALLAVLLLHRNQVVSIDQLVEALWPEGPPSQPEASIHSSVARLRRAVEPQRAAGEPAQRLVRVPPGYQLKVTDDELDASRFTAGVGSARAATAAGDVVTARATLGAALDEWRGGALAEFLFAPFAEAAIAHLEEQRLSALDERIALDLALGDTGLVPELEQLVVAHPLRERFWEHLIVALYRAGRAPDAVRRAHELRSELAELGLEPSPRLAVLEQAVLNHDAALLRAEPLLAASPTSATSPTTNHPHPTATVGPPVAREAATPRRLDSATPMPRLPRWWSDERRFVGRDEQLAQLSASWCSVLDGDVVMLVLAGEPGIGKTWLAIEAAERMRSEGAVVLAGRCSPEPMLPYEPFVEAFGRLVDSLDDDAIAGLGVHARRLAEILPNRATRLSGAPTPEPSPEFDEAEQFLLFEAVAALVAVVTAVTPLVLVVDDLQWADSSTLNLADHLLRSDDVSRTAVLFTLRDTDVPADGLLRRHLDRMSREHLAALVTLPGFSADDVAEVIAEVGGESEPDLVSTLHAATGGNPFFVVELARSLQARGLPVGPTAQLRLPATAQALVRSRLGLLDTEQREVLGVAALIGRRIDVDLLVRTLERPVHEVAKALDEASRVGLLVEEDDAQSFRHDLVRAELERSSGAAWRSERHRRIADALIDRARQRGEDPDEARGELVDALAHHYAMAARGGDPTHATRFALLAGRRAGDQHAHATAAARYAAGLEALGHASTRDRRAELDLLLALAEAWRKAGEMDHCGEVGRRALPLAVKHGSVGQMRDAAVAATRCAGLLTEEIASVLAGELGPLEVRLARDATATSDDQAALALVRAAIAVAHREDATAIARLHEALDLLPTITEPATVVWVIDEAITTLGETLELATRLALSDELLALVEGSGVAEHELLAHSLARWLRLTAGEVEAARVHAERYELLAEGLGMPRYLAGVAQRRAMEAILAGEFSAAEAHATETLVHRPDPEFFEGYAAQLALVRLEQGRAHEMLGTFQATDEAAGLAWRAGAALFAVESGDERTAAAALRTFRAELPAAPRDVNWLLALALAARATYELGDAEAAGELLVLLRPYSGRITTGGTGAVSLGPVDVALAELHSVLGDLDAAEAALARCEVLLEGRRVDAVRARVSLLHGEMISHHDRTRADEALHHLTEGIATASHIELGGPLVHRATVLLSELR